ncbi:MAG: hypothetical protein GKR91_20345 [Pseudomonadales bacterium]|nr:hypothetical protein [Pseudomonadales bacterium]
MNNYSDINLVIAHKLEAELLINWFELELDESNEFRIYRNSAGMQAIVAGMGVDRAKAGTEYLGDRDAQSERSRAWLNIGIAGHQSAKIGSCLSAHKITHRSSGSTRFPALVFTNIATTEVVTVDEPEIEYPEDVAYEMEAAGFWDGALKYSTLELVQCLKIISDNKEHSTEKVTKDSILALMASKQAQIVDCCNQLQALADAYNGANALGTTYERLLSSVHLTVTQQNQLKRLCQRYAALGREEELQQILTHKFQSSKELLTQMNEQIKG